MFSFFTCAHPPCTRWKSNTCECFADSRKPPAMATASVAVVSSRRSNFPGCPTSPPTMKKGFSKSFRSEEHTSELQSRGHLVCRLLLEKKKQTHTTEID